MRSILLTGLLLLTAAAPAPGDADIRAGYCGAVVDNALTIAQSVQIPPGSGPEKTRQDVLSIGGQMRTHFSQELQSSGALSDPARKQAVLTAQGQGQADSQHCLATSLVCAVQAGVPVDGGTFHPDKTAGTEIGMRVLACALKDGACGKVATCALDGGLPLQTLMQAMPRK
jgi:hypothetical protein